MILLSVAGNFPFPSTSLFGFLAVPLDHLAHCSSVFQHIVRTWLYIVVKNYTSSCMWIAAHIRPWI